MRTWAGGWRGDVLLRVAGLMLIGLAAISINMLLRRHGGQRFDPSMADIGLATMGFLGGTCGSAMTALGRHLGDEVEVGERWRSPSE